MVSVEVFRSRLLAPNVLHLAKPVLAKQGLVDIAPDANRMHMRRIVERLIVSERSAVAAK